MRRLLALSIFLIAAPVFGQQVFPNGYTYYADFEIGSMEEWSGWGNGPYSTPPTQYLGLQSCSNGQDGATKSVAHSGSYSYQVTVNGGGAQTNCTTYTTFTSFDPVHFRFYVYLAPGFAASPSGSTIAMLANAGFANSYNINLESSGGKIVLNSACGGSGTHNLTTGVWHSIEGTYNVGAETLSLLLDGSAETNGTSCSLVPSPVDFVIGAQDWGGATSGTLYFDDVVINTTAIGSPAAAMVVRHSPSTFGRTALPMLVTMWGATGSDTLVATIDGRSAGIYTNVKNQMSVQLPCCTNYAPGNHTLVVQDKLGSTVHSSWTETIPAWNSNFPIEIDGYNNLSSNGQGVFPILPFWVNVTGSSTSQADLSFWTTTYVTVAGWVDPENSVSESQFAADIATNKSAEGVMTLGPNNPMWTNWNSAPYPSAQTASIAGYASALANNNNLFGYTWFDEPDWNQIQGTPITAAVISSWTAVTHANDPNHLVWSNTTANYPVYRMENSWTYPTAVADVMSMDQYPLSSWCGGNDQTIASWVSFVDEFQRVNYGLVPYNFDLEGETVTSGCAPTGAQARMEAWLATIHGAKSITWFLSGWGTTADELTGEAAFKASSQMPVVLAALTAPGTNLSVTSNQTAVGTRVDAMVKQTTSTVMIFAQRLTDCVAPGASGNPCVVETDSPLSTTLTVNGCSITGTALVVGENRTVPVTNCAVTDTFNAFDTHIYQLSGFILPLSVAVSTPATGATVSGGLTISGTAADGVAISSVAISTDGSSYALASGTTLWTYSLDNALANGAHTIQAMAWDSAGNVATSTVVNIIVNNTQVGAQQPGPSASLYSNPFYTCVRNFYVSTAGSDSNPGSQASPWLTIQHADSSSRQPGDCINVEPGTYAAGANLSYGGNLASPTGYVVYRCTTLDGCKITEADHGFAIVSSGSGPNYLVYDGFELAASTQSAYGQGIEVSDGNDNGLAAKNSSHHVWVLNNIIHGYGQSGVQMNDGEYFYVIHNQIYNNSNVTCAPQQGSGISFYENKAFSGYAQTQSDLAYAPFHNVVSYNISFNNMQTQCGNGTNPNDTDGEGIIMDTFDNAGGTAIPYPSSTSISFNVTFQNGGRGIEIYRSSAGGFSVVNNTSFDNNLDPYDDATDRPEFQLGGVVGASFFNNIAFPVPATSANDPRCKGVNYSGSPWNLPKPCPLQLNSSFEAASFTGSGNDPTVIDSSNVWSNNISSGGTPPYAGYGGGGGNAIYSPDVMFSSSPINPNQTDENYGIANLGLASVSSSASSGFNFALLPASPAIGFGLAGSSQSVDVGACSSAFSACPSFSTGTVSGLAVAIVSPLNGAVISGTVTVSGTATDTVAVSSVALSVDGGTYTVASGTASWIFNLNTSTMTNGPHTLQAKVWDSTGNVAVSNLVNVIVGNAVPPSTGTFTNVTTTQLQANWGSNFGPQGTRYIAVLSTAASPNTNGFSGNISSNTLNLDAVFTGLNPNTTYYVSVATAGSGGAGVYTSLGSTATLAAVPSSAAVSNVAQTTLTLAWNADGNPAGTQYLAQISNNLGFISPTSSSTFNTSATFSALGSNTTYYLRVAAINSEGVLTAFDVAAASSTLVADPLSAPPSNIAASSITANWGADGNSFTTLYIAEISTNAFVTVLASVPAQSVSATFTGLAADTAYSLRVAAIGNDGTETPFTALPSTSTLLLPPAASTMTFVSVSLASITIQWLAGGDGPGTLYNAQMSSNNFASVIASSLTYNLNAVFGTTGAGPALAPNTVYSFQVQATTTSNSSAFVFLGSTATPAVPPAGTLVVSVASTSVSLAWSADGNPVPGTTFQLWQDLANNFPNPVETYLTSTAPVVSSLNPSTTYYFKVRVLGDDGLFTAFDSIVSTMTLAPAPGAPGTPVGVALGVSSISWTWSAAPDAVYYQTLRAQTGAVLASTPTLAFFDTHLATNTPYGLLVRGVDASGPGALSLPSTTYTLAAPPAAAVVNHVFATSATLSWALNTNPSGTDAEIQRSTDDVDFVSLGSSFTTLNYVDTSLLGCSTYYYRVRNLNGNGLLTSFDFAAPFVTSNTIPDPASGLSAQSLTGGRVELTWTPSPSQDIVGYQLFYDAGTGSINYSLPSDLLASLSPSATYFETAVLPSSAAYTFTVLSLNRCDTLGPGVFAMAGSSMTLNDVRADIIGPASGHHVYGNDLTVYAQLVAGTPAQTAQVTFRYRRTGTLTWSTMTAVDVFNPNPATVDPYFIHWNVDGLAPGSYDLSAVAMDVSGSSDAAPDVVTVVVDPVTPDILETLAGALVQSAYTDIPNTFNTGGNAAGSPLVSITVPGGLFSGSTVSVTVTPSATPPGTTPPNGLTLVPNLMLQVALSNGQSMLNGGSAPISFFSPNSPGHNPQIYVYNTITDTWSQDFATTYNPATHQITGNTPHFSVFAVLSGGGETPASDLSGVRVYPNPYRPGSNNPDLGGGNTGIFFDQLPTSASIKIYTVSGQLVSSFDASSAAGAVNWDARNDKGRDVASGLYLAVITSPGTKTVTRKILVVR